MPTPIEGFFEFGMSIPFKVADFFKLPPAQIKGILTAIGILLIALAYFVWFFGWWLW